MNGSAMLTPSLLDRLLASTLVPREAKVAAIESWQRELAQAPIRDALHRQLEQRLAEASRLLDAPALEAPLPRFAVHMAMGNLD
jgi:hypothetical protein